MTDQQQALIEGPAPCPLCGNPALIGQTLDDAWYAMCSQDKCIRIDCYWPSRDEAIVAWNRRTSPTQSSGEANIDHQIDMANVGEALMEAMRDYSPAAFMKTWRPCDCPSEIVGDLLSALEEASAKLQLAVNHIEHMARWIDGTNCGDIKGIYSFEALGEDMPGIKSALAGAEGRR